MVLNVLSHVVRYKSLKTTRTNDGMLSSQDDFRCVEMNAITLTHQDVLVLLLLLSTVFHHHA